MVKIGLVVPQSNFLPRISRQFRDAFKSGLADANADPDISLQVGGFMNRGREIARLFHQMVLEDEVDLIVMPMNPVNLFHLQGMMTSEEVPVIACSMGENVLPADAENKFLRLNSFDLWTSGWLLGHEGVSRYGPRVTMACSYQDGAYGFFAAVASGVAAAGGEIVNSLVSRRRQDDANPYVDTDKLLEVNTDLIFACYSASDAAEFIATVRTTDRLADIPILSMPFGVQDSVLAKAREHASGVVTVSTLPTTTPQTTNIYLRDPYSLVAYEAGGIAGMAINASNQHSAPLLESLDAIRFESPRGRIGLTDTDLRPQPGIAHYLQTVEFKNLEPQLTTLAALDVSPASTDDCALQRLSDDFRGWTNPYLLA